MTKVSRIAERDRKISKRIKHKRLPEDKKRKKKDLIKLGREEKQKRLELDQ